MLRGEGSNWRDRSLSRLPLFCQEYFKTFFAFAHSIHMRYAKISPVPPYSSREFPAFSRLIRPGFLFGIFRPVRLWRACPPVADLPAGGGPAALVPTTLKTPSWGFDGSNRNSVVPNECEEFLPTLLPFLILQTRRKFHMNFSTRPNSIGLSPPLPQFFVTRALHSVYRPAPNAKARPRVQSSVHVLRMIV